jgi:LysM repeat protein
VPRGTEPDAVEQPPTPPFFARPGRQEPPRPAARPERDADDEWADDDDEDQRYDRRRAASSGGLGRDRRPKVGDTRRPRPADPGPSWERPRRYEAYPTLKTRMGLPSVPRVGVMAIALGLAAVVLFLVGPQLLGIGRPSGPAGVNPSASASPAAPSVSIAPTPIPAPTAQIYLVQAGDTMSRIANRFSIPLDQLIEANRDTIPDPDNLQIGDQVTIPATPPDEIGESPAASVEP